MRILKSKREAMDSQRLIQMYWTEYEHAQTESNFIKAHQLLLQGIQVVAGVLASNLATFALSPLNFVGNYGSVGHWMIDLGQEILQEMVIENVISTIAMDLGFSSGFSNMAGEIMGGWCEVNTNFMKLDSLDVKMDVHTLYQNLQTAVAKDAALQTAFTASMKENAWHFESGTYSIAAQVKDMRQFIAGQGLSTLLNQFSGKVHLTLQLFDFAANYISAKVARKEFFMLTDLKAKLGVEKFDDWKAADWLKKKRVMNALWENRHLSVKDFLSSDVLRDQFNVPMGKEMFFKFDFKGMGELTVMEDGSTWSDQNPFMESVGTVDQPGSLIKYLMRADGVRLIDPKESNFRSRILKIISSRLDHDILHTPESIKKEFDVHNDDGTITRASSSLGSSKQFHIDRIASKKYLLSNYYLFTNLKYMFKGINIQLSGAQKVSLDTISRNIEVIQTLSSKYQTTRSTLSSILRHCKILQGFFPSFSKSSISSEYEMDSTSNVGFSGFGSILLQEFLDLDLVFDEIKTKYSSSEATLKITEILNSIDKIFLKYFNNEVTAKATAASIMKYISDFSINNLAKKQMIKLQVSDDIMAFDSKLNEFFDIFETKGDNLGHISLSADQKQFKHYLDIIEKWIGNGGRAQIFYSKAPSLNNVDKFKQAFGFDEDSTHMITETQLTAVDLFNQEMISFFEILSSLAGISDINYASSWSQAMSENKLYHEIWENTEKDLDNVAIKTISFLPIDAFKVKGSIINALTEYNGILIGEYQSRNAYEYTESSSFADSATIDGINYISINPDSKVYRIGGNHISMSLHHKGRPMHKIAPSYKSSSKRGVCPDDFIVLTTYSGSQKKIDTILISEHLDYFGTKNDWYTIPKQLSGKAVLERGGPLMEVSNGYAKYIWYLKFPVPTTKMLTKQGVEIPKIIGKYAPLLLSSQKKMLGQIFKSSDLFLDSTIINELSFENNMRNLHRIVQQNPSISRSYPFISSSLINSKAADVLLAKIKNQFGITSDIEAKAIALSIEIQEQFGISVDRNSLNTTGDIVENLKIKRLVPEGGFSESGGFNSYHMIEQEFTLHMQQFWSNVKNSNQQKVIDHIIGSQLGEVASIEYSNLAYAIIQRYFISLSTSCFDPDPDVDFP